MDRIQNWRVRRIIYLGQQMELSSETQIQQQASADSIN